jgi:hypothetical protein
VSLLPIDTSVSLRKDSLPLLAQPAKVSNAKKLAVSNREGFMADSSNFK